MKKVMFLIPSLGDGGAERVASVLSKYFPEDVEAVFALFENKVEYACNGRIVSLDLKAGPGILKKIKNLILRYYGLKRLIEAERPDAVISFMESSNLLNILCNKAGAYVSVRAYPSITYSSSPVNRFIISLYNRARRVISVSEETRRDLIENFGLSPDKVVTIYNPANVDEISRLAGEPIEDETAVKIFRDYKVIINAGRLNAQKAHDDLIKAFALAYEADKDTRLVIMGRGELEGYLKNLASSLGVEKAVYFLNFQKNPFKYISRSKLFVLSSRFEGFPNAVIEAMICGVPILSTDCKSGPSEIFEANRFGNLVPVGDIGRMASRMTGMIKSSNGALLNFYAEKLREYSAGKIAREYLRALGVIKEDGKTDGR